MLPKSRDFTLPASYQDDFQTLKNLLASHTSRAYFVGGCVRDFFLGHSSDDFDIEVYDLDEEAFAAVMEELGALKVGRSFHVYKWGPFDLALPRTETKTGVGHTAFSTKLAADEKHASMRRDFTMNALMLNIFTLELLDFWEGLDDLQQRRLRLIDATKFAEDSLRVLRAMQFAARFGFKVDDETIAVCRNINLDDLSKERIFGEFEKLFKAPLLHVGLYYGVQLGIFEKLFGLCIEKEDFIALARELKQKPQWIATELQEYFFLYTLKNLLHVNLEPLLNALNTPNRYRKILEQQKRRPKRMTARFLNALSLKYPLKEWLGCDKQIIHMAKEIGVYEQSYDHGVKIQDVLKDGFEKAAIKEEYKHRVCARLRFT